MGKGAAWRGGRGARLLRSPSSTPTPHGPSMGGSRDLVLLQPHSRTSPCATVPACLKVSKLPFHLWSQQGLNGA